MNVDQMTNPVWRGDARLRAEVLEEAYRKLQRLSYSALRRVVDSAFTRLVVGRDGKKHQLQVRVQMKQRDSQDIQVTVTLPAGGRRQPELIQCFVRKSQKWRYRKGLPEGESGRV